MSVVSPRATLRWKEWIPLITQQQRLRNLIQIIAYNIDPYEKCPQMERRTGKNSYYYTLHLTTMSAPFYTSEKLESDNPKWGDIEINQINGASNGVVIRLWCHSGENVEQVVTVWGVYFSGLAYLGSRLVTTDPSMFNSNTIVLHMQGGYFTAPHCFKQPAASLPSLPPQQRVLSKQMPPADVRPSYTVSLLLRLHSIQQAIKQHSVAAASLRERISEGGLNSGSDQKESAMLRRLLHRTKPLSQPRHHHQLNAVKKEMEEVRFRVNLLTHERDKKNSQLRQKIAEKNKLVDENQNKDLELVEKYRTLHKDVERLKELKRLSIDVRENLFSVNSMLQALRRKRIAELNFIYPISQVGEEKLAICGVHLPNSENFSGHDEIMISVALGFVAHLTQMIAFFLHIPLRYPIVHAGSRSKVIDYINSEISENEREFPLYSRGKDKVQFNYAVYLLNKNIAQLRWYCSLVTSDLRPTLANLLALLNLKPSHHSLGVEINKRTLSSSNLEFQGMGGNRGVVSPLSGRHRSRVSPNPLSYSLDKGLDQIGPRICPVPRQRSITHNGSDPPDAPAPPSSEDDGQTEFLRAWAAQGPAPMSSDVEVDSERSSRSNDPVRDSSTPEESLASIINKMNSPSINKLRRKVDLKCPSKIVKTEVGRETDSDESFVRQSIRQVTSRQTFLDS